MEVFKSLLPLVYVFSTLTTITGSSPFKAIVCNQCDQWCAASTVMTNMRETRLCKAGPPGVRGAPGPQGPIGKSGDTGPPGRDGEVNMTAIEYTIDRKIKEALYEIFNRSGCHAVELESASARNESGGVYDLYIPLLEFKKITCDVRDEGGNWIVFQRRIIGDVDFFRNWADYARGFGNSHGDFWLGLDSIHQLTKGGGIELKINVITRDGVHLFAKYSNFKVGSASENYRLTVGGYSGNATDSLTYHNDRQFTTKDADHDQHPTLNCAAHHEAAWWYGACYNSNLNGNFKKLDWNGIVWRDAENNFNKRNLRFSEMKFRRKL